MDSGYNYVGFQSAVRVSQRRPIRVTLMTSSYMSTIAALKQKLERYQIKNGDVIKSVQILELPYSGLSYYKFPDETQIDVMVLCHSINNHGFGITDVTDSLYDEFLAYCKGAIGKQNIVVIAHDFPPQSKEIREVTMRGFRSSQPTTFEMAGLAMVCGQMEHTLDTSQEDWDSLVKILEDSPKRVTHAGPASRRGVEQPPSMNIAHDDCMMMEEQSRDESAVLASSWSWWWPRRWGATIQRWWRPTSENQELGGRTDGEIHDHGYNHDNGNTTPDDDSCKQYFDATNREPGSDNKESRRPRVIICTSLGSDSIKGLKEKLEGKRRRAFQTLRRRKHHMTFEVREEILPYSYLDEFRFPSDIGRHDAMILCHSITNRGLSITDTESALYDKYLAYCNETFGTSRVAVIVHDFNLEVNLDNHMAAFKRDQPKTFDLAGLVLLGGNLTRTSKIELRGDGWKQVKTFVRNAVKD